MRVRCELCREAISARLDGETEPAEPALVDAHLRDCPACTRWQGAAAAANRAVRLRPVRTTPDLVPAVTNLVEAPADNERRLPRIGLGVVAVSQLGVAVYLIFRSISGYALGDHGNGHLFHEGIAWNLALGAAFAVAALRVKRLDGLIRLDALMPVLTAFVVVITAFSIPDVLTGAASIPRVLRHLPAVVGLALLYWEHRPLPTPYRPRWGSGDARGPQRGPAARSAA